MDTRIQAGNAGPVLPLLLPPGSYRLSRGDDAALRAAAGSQIGDGDAHPITAFIVALGGMGVPIARVCELIDMSIARGPVLARAAIRYARPMACDVAYQVEASVTRIDRKPSRRYGSADHITLELRVASDGVRFADVDLVWVMPGVKEE